ncbi:hydroxyisourate hydrolase [Aeromicrobium sp. PE09-221]|uniref:hydroxyisourate hydrolase n=1 Tax=Aeromicrobium sp. PE09-221 TaxID=1898043 RepID=UPI000B3ED64C|nr:hydroxyisourate hydrolase [Aeromicrobium sp. PE09-221]OUZ07070.1 hydroxyisourate hydrolase [Aeromicrobium sp. PE09-221]
MSSCSTHVLDATRGTPAAGLPVELLAADGSVSEARTDGDGRARFDAELVPGEHTLRFSTGVWFAGQGRDCFYPRVELTFLVGAREHCHVALLLSPFSYTSYRGS